MNLHQGLDYKLYKIYIWGGLAALVIYFFVAVLIFETHLQSGSTGFLILILPVMFYVAGIFLYWWWVFLFKDRLELDNIPEGQEDEIPGIKSLRNWNTLHQAMAISGGDLEELKRNYTKAKIPVLIWFGASNLLAVWIFCPIVLGSLGFIQGFGVGTWLAGVVIWIIAMLAGTPILLSIGAKSAGTAYFAPLGLGMTELPSFDPDVLSSIEGDQNLMLEGAAVIEGKRRGRRVHIETLRRDSLTLLQADAPEFEVKSEAGKLTPEKGAPDQVVKALKSLRKAKRWQGVQVFAGPEALVIQRHSKGTNMWLYDLWLAEYLLDKINANKT